MRLASSPARRSNHTTGSNSYFEPLFHSIETTMPNPILYVYYHSIWSNVTRLAKHDLGFTDAEVEEKQVWLNLGEHLDAPFLKINPNGTVPALVADGQAYQDSISVLKYLIQHARGPARNETMKPIVEILQKPEYSPAALKIAARSEEELQVTRKTWQDNVVNRQQKTEALAAQDNIAAKEHWAPRRDRNALSFRVYGGTASEEEKRQFFWWAQNHWAMVVGFIADTLPTYLPEAGFVDGAEPGINDFELGGWLTSVIGTTGGLDNIEKVARKPLNEKVKKYFEIWRARQGWQDTYKAGLY